MGLETWLAREADAPALTALIEESFRYYFEGEPPDGVAAAWAARMIKGDGPEVLLVADNGRVVAFATHVFLDSARSAGGTLFLKNLYVAEAARGSGAGAAALRALARRAVSLGCERLDWTAETDNPRALEFYEKLGAPMVAEKVYYRFDGDRLTAFAADASS